MASIFADLTPDHLRYMLSYGVVDDPCVFLYQDQRLSLCSAHPDVLMFRPTSKKRPGRIGIRKLEKLLKKFHTLTFRMTSGEVLELDELARVGLGPGNSYNEPIHRFKFTLKS